MKTIKEIAPVQLGKILAIFYGLLSLIFTPIIIMKTISHKDVKPTEIAICFLLPIFYIVGGFIGGIIVAALYNLCAKLVGGIKITLEDDEIIQRN